MADERALSATRFWLQLSLAQGTRGSAAMLDEARLLASRPARPLHLRMDGTSESTTGAPSAPWGAHAPRTPPPPPALASRPLSPPPDGPPPDAGTRLPVPRVLLRPLPSRQASVTRYAIDQTDGPGGEITVEPHGTNDWQSSLYGSEQEGFGDLYEAVPGLGDAAAWTPLAHTLRVQSSGLRVTVELDLAFGAEATGAEFQMACEAARVALSSR